MNLQETVEKIQPIDRKTVSYTHLYIVCCNHVQTSFSNIYLSFALIDTIAVSYTHLDVYKRQQ